eukprot:NODE_257_length_11653_cov_0.298858.p1 type:complete len:755 gc:universal NODE_257_length_11653_cov_0.298858:8731-6467(-)
MQDILSKILDIINLKSFETTWLDSRKMILFYYIFGVISDCQIVIQMAQKLGLDRSAPHLYANIKIDCCLSWEITYISCSNENVLDINWSRIGLNGDVTDLVIPSKLLGLILSYNDLTGHLNFKLPLSFFDITGNRLTGSLNTTIPSSLNYLAISRNQLSGYLDFDFYGTFIDVSNNKFIGGLPRMNTTTELYCQMNQLNGTLTNKLPATFIRGSFAHNQFYGPIGVIPNAESIRLDYNLLSGNITNFPGSLTYFSASHNLLTGMIPYLVPNLNFLHLDHNKLSGLFEPDVTNILELTISHNSLTGNMSNWLSAESVQNLDISNNHFYGEISIYSSNCALNATYNNISSVNIIGSACLVGGSGNFCNFENNPISNFSVLPINCQSNLSPNREYGCEQLAIFAKSMQLDVTLPNYYQLLNQDCCLMTNVNCKQGIVDRIDWDYLNQFGPLITLNLDLLPKGITVVSLVDNNFVKITGQTPPNLVILGLAYNRIIGALPDFSKLFYLVVFYNQFSGPIKEKFENADTIVLDGNQFNGTLPEAPNASCYSVDYNQFDSLKYIPPKADYFYVQNNVLSGELPGFGVLTHVYLNNNLLSGTIPLIPEGVEVLDLSFNQFTNMTGPFPSSLVRLYLQSNKINAVLPILPPNMLQLLLGMPDQVDSNQISGEIAFLELSSDKYLYLYNNLISNVYIAAPNTLKYCDITKNPILNRTDLGICVNASDSFLKQVISSTSNDFELQRKSHLFRVYFNQKSIFKGH